VTLRSSYRLSVIVCAHNEARFLPACLHSLLAQTRVPDELVVVNNASTDETRAVAQQIPYVYVVDEPRKGLVVARETGRRAATGDILVYLDADCRAPLTWLERVERRFLRAPTLIALSGPYRYYDWDWWGRLLIRAYDFTHNAMGKGAVFRLYVRNFTSELLHHRPRDTSHVDVRT
jgi:glycosyltransferase involved in cell wall biosynthesis